MLLVIVLILAVLIILLGAYITYRIAFYAPKHITDKEVKYHLPSGPAYQNFQKELKACVESMLARSFEPVTITTFDGQKLYARYYHTENHAPVHIIFHGYKSNAILDCSGGTAYAGFTMCLIVSVPIRKSFFPVSRWVLLRYSWHLI